MNIVYISNSTLPSRSANSIHVMKMCQAFAKNGHTVKLLAPRRRTGVEPGVADLFSYYGVEKSFCIRHLFCIESFGKSLAYDLSVMAELSRGRPDLVYGRFVPGCHHAAMMQIPVVFESHSPMWLEPFYSNWYFQRLVKRKTFVGLVVITHALKEMCVASTVLEENQIVVAPDGADVVEDASPLPDWPGRKDVLQVGYCGHLYPGRGIRLIVELARQMPGVDFHIVGGTEADIRRWSCGALPGNTFFHGFVSPSIVHRYRNSCDVLVAPHQKKVATAGAEHNDISAVTSPLKLFEYMSSRKAIIASDLPVLREVLTDTNAILVPPDDVLAWKAAITRLKDPSLRARLADCAHREFLEKYEWRRRAEIVLRGCKDTRE